MITLGFVILITSTACSRALSDLLPENMGDNGTAALDLKTDEASARKNIDRDPAQKTLLDELKPESIGCAVYTYSGKTIVAALARFRNADDAYGMYTGLTVHPEKYREDAGGEIAYKAPYLSGRKGAFAFWFYSPGNSTDPFPFINEEARRLIRKLPRKATETKCSYHLKLLPAENRYAGSIFYIRSRAINGIRIANSYGAEYVIGSNKSRIFIEKHDSEIYGLRFFNDHRFECESAGNKVTEYDEFRKNTF
jgi:hypothetical protein